MNVSEAFRTYLVEKQKAVRCPAKNKAQGVDCFPDTVIHAIASPDANENILPEMVFFTLRTNPIFAATMWLS